jgi:hypothetical protein
VSNSFDAVAKGMSVVIEGINAPFVPDMGMSVKSDPINNRVSESCVRVLVINLGSQ